VVPDGVRAVLGVPLRLGGVPLGSLDVYLDAPHAWDESEQRALVRYSDVIESTLAAAFSADRAGALAAQLQYALDYRVVIERAVGFLMASNGVDAVAAFNRLGTAARNTRRKIGDVSEEVLAESFRRRSGVRRRRLSPQLPSGDDGLVPPTERVPTGRD
jgi:hypothetical protein